jgi:hypothetical protein
LFNASLKIFSQANKSKMRFSATHTQKKLNNFHQSSKIPTTNNQPSTERTNMNRAATQKLWLALSECNDLPEEVTDAIRRGFETRQRLEELWQTKRNALQQITNDLNDAQRQAAPKLIAELSAGKKNTLHQSTEQILLLTQAQTEAQLTERLASQAMQTTESAISTPLTKFRDTFIQWVAQRRSIEPFACGLTKHITPEVVETWRNLSVVMYPRFDENLELPSMNRIPVVFEEGWTQKHRSSIAWIWQRIAEGKFEYVPQPDDKQGGTRTMRITAFANNIPTAPPIPTKSNHPFG